MTWPDRSTTPPPEPVPSAGGRLAGLSPGARAAQPARPAPRSRTVGAVVLAAGGGSRFAGPTHKLLAPYRGRPLALWAVDHALESAVGPVAVVTGAADLRHLLPHQVTVLENPNWLAGQAGSLQVAIGWATCTGVDAVVVALGDQPSVPASAWQALAAAQGPIATATFRGRRSPPVRLDRSVWPELPTTGDAGARAVMARHPEWVTDVPCAGEPDDVDTEADLRRLEHDADELPRDVPVDRLPERAHDPRRAPGRTAELRRRQT